VVQRKRRKVLEPKARLLAGIVPKLIGLDILVWLANDCAHASDWILKANLLDGGLPATQEEHSGIVGFPLALGPAVIPMQTG
jgi:hypothetical protein